MSESSRRLVHLDHAGQWARVCMCQAVFGCSAAVNSQAIWQRQCEKLSSGPHITLSS